jgi:hypothetical protein
MQKKYLYGFLNSKMVIRFQGIFSNPVWCITLVLETMAMPSGYSIQHIAPIAIYMLIMEFQKA